MQTKAFTSAAELRFGAGVNSVEQVYLKGDTESLKLSASLASPLWAGWSSWPRRMSYRPRTDRALYKEIGGQLTKCRLHFLGVSSALGS